MHTDLLKTLLLKFIQTQTTATDLEIEICSEINSLIQQELTKNEKTLEMLCKENPIIHRYLLYLEYKEQLKDYVLNKITLKK